MWWNDYALKMVHGWAGHIGRMSVYDPERLIFKALMGAGPFGREQEYMMYTSLALAFLAQAAAQEARQGTEVPSNRGSQGAIVSAPRFYPSQYGQIRRRQGKGRR